ncbi:8811_t:CDS:2, partial [Racocetra fulgida]
TVFLSSGTNDTENLGAPGVVLISEENYRRIIADLVNTKGKEPEDVINDLDSDISSQFDELMFDTQTNETDTSNLEENQQTEDSQINDYFKFYKRKQSKSFSNDFENNEETDELPASINVTANTSSQANSALDNERINDNQEDDFDVSDDNSPGWLECEDCYGNKKELCEYCNCSICKWKGDRGHILLCEGSCGKNFYRMQIER